MISYPWQVMQSFGQCSENYQNRFRRLTGAILPTPDGGRAYAKHIPHVAKLEACGPIQVFEGFSCHGGLLALCDESAPREGRRELTTAQGRRAYSPDGSCISPLPA